MSGLLFPKTSAQGPAPGGAYGFRVSTSVYGRPIPIVWGRNRIAGNWIWLADYSTGQSGSGKGGGGGSGRYAYQSAVMYALCEGPLGSPAVGSTWMNGSLDGGGPGGFANRFTEFTGSYSQNPWSYLSSNHPAQALAYRGLVYWAATDLTLSSPNLPQTNQEVLGNYQLNPGGGVYDCDPKDILTDFLTNANYGVAGFSASWLGDLSAWSTYCKANDILLSPALESQEAAASIIERLGVITNSDPLWHEGALTMIPRGDSNATANGVTYTPNLTPVYDLDDDSYLDQHDGSAPLKVTRTDPADAYNQLSVEVVDRANGYQPTPAEWRDQGEIDRYGLKPAPSVITAHEIATPARGAIVAQLVGQRALYTRRIFKCTLPVTYCLLEPGDLVTFTDSTLGLSRQLARITEIDEGDIEKGDIEIVAEEVLVGMAAKANYGSTSSTNTPINMQNQPGNVATPVFVVAPYGLTQDNWLELWIGLTGGADWGGCQVWVSDDGSSYKYLDTFTGRSRMGVTTTSLAAAGDPDYSSTLGVDLTTSQGALTGGTPQNANDYSTLSLVGAELISFVNAALTSQYKYNLSGLRRGVYGSPIATPSAPSGSTFLRLDGAVFKHTFAPTDQGKTLYFKFLSFNTFGNQVQALADVPAYSFALTQQYSGVPPMLTPSGLELFNGGSSNVFSGRDAKFAWRRNSSFYSYELGQEPFGAEQGASDPFFKDFKVQIQKPDGTVLRTEFTTAQEYTYTYEKNFEDNAAGVPIRAFTIFVWQRGTLNQLSAIPAQMAVSNPNAGLPALDSLIGGLRNIFLSITPPNESDWVGTDVWMSANSSFTPGPSNLVYSGPDSVIVLSANAGSTNYLKYASFDTFGHDSETVSGAVAVTTSLVQQTDVANAAIGAAQLIAAAVTAAAIAANAVTTTAIADGSITTPKLVANAITANLIAANAVGALQIAANSVYTAALQANAVTANQIAANAITSVQIAANAVTAAAIAANAVYANAIQANAVTADKISVANLSAVAVNTGNLTVDANGSIKGGQTAFNTGAGFFLGYSGGKYVFSLGNSAGDLIAWDGGNFTIQAANVTVGSQLTALTLTATYVTANTYFALLGGNPGKQATDGDFRLAPNMRFISRNAANSGNFGLLTVSQLNSVDNIVKVGTDTATGDSAGVILRARSGANVPGTLDVQSSLFTLWKNTSDGTVKLYYNDGGTLKSVALT